jgi:hypothetical protein
MAGSAVAGCSANPALNQDSDADLDQHECRTDRENTNAASRRRPRAAEDYREREGSPDDQQGLLSHCASVSGKVRNQRRATALDAGRRRYHQ